MWICNDCGAVFENPREYYEHDTGYYGMDCPHCGSDDIDEAKRCSECDEWVNEKNLVNGLCHVSNTLQNRGFWTFHHIFQNV